MAKVFLMLNPCISLDSAQRYWVELGDTIRISPRHRIEVKRVRTYDEQGGEGTDIQLTEFVNERVAHVHTVRNGQWMNLLTRSGYLEVIPKAIAFDARGDESRC